MKTARSPDTFPSRDGSTSRSANALIAVWAWLWPVVSTGILVIIAVAPATGPQTAFSLAGLLPLLAVHYWTITGRTTYALVLAFTAGLVVDGVSGGPLGYWALVYVAAVEVAAVMAGLALDSIAAHGVALVASLAAAATVQWAVVFAYVHTAPDPWGLATATVLAAAVYPLVGIVLDAGMGRGRS